MNLNRRDFLTGLGAGALLAALPRAAFSRNTPTMKPNILIILADDLGYGDVSCYNPTGKIPTPHIDRLAAQGMRFTDGHSSSSVCSPSRYGLLTGRYHWRTGQAGIVDVFGPPLIAADRLTLPASLRQQGYHTACIGKWHLGWDWPIPADKKPLFRQTRGKGSDEAPPTDAQLALWQDVFAREIPGGPTARGFDEYFGTDVPNWPPYCFIANNRTVGVPSRFLPGALLKDNLASQGGPALAEWELNKILPTLGDRASEFIARQAKQNKPFFLYLPLTAPHTPLAVNAAWRGKSGLNAYADFVMETDAVIGRVLDALDQSGAADNTIVIFTSDNGCAPYIGIADMEAKGHFPSGPFRGYKADAWEGGHRVPFIVRWPGTVKPGSVCAHNVQQVDLMATLTGNVGEDSVNLMPLLRGADKPVRDHAVNQSNAGVFALRQGSWKLICGNAGGPWTKDDDTQPVRLYNLADDPGEKRNLAATEPKRVAELTALMREVVNRHPNDKPINVPSLTP